MQFRTQRVSKAPFLNVTALIDVFLLLVLFLLCCMGSSTVSLHQLQVRLPTSSSAALSQHVTDVLSVEVDPKGAVHVEQQVFDPPLGQDFKHALRAMLGDHLEKDVAVAIHGDVLAPYAAIIAVMDAVKGAGAKQVILKTKPEGSL